MGDSSAISSACRKAPVEVVPDTGVSQPPSCRSRRMSRRPSIWRDRTGRFYVTAPDPALPPKHSAQQRRGHCPTPFPSMVAHEAYPGHHLQLPPPRGSAPRCGATSGVRSWWRAGRFTPSSSWSETGFYAREQARLFQLVNLLWRAVRVVLDVGLHTRGHESGRGGGLHGRAPADRASERRGRGRGATAPGRHTSCAMRSAGASFSASGTPIVSGKAVAIQRAAVSRRSDGIWRAASESGELGHGARRVNGRNRRGPTA